MKSIMIVLATATMLFGVTAVTASAYYGGYGGYRSYGIPPAPGPSPCWHWDGYRWFWACQRPFLSFNFDFDRFHRFDFDRFHRFDFDRFHRFHRFDFDRDDRGMMRR